MSISATDRRLRSSAFISYLISHCEKDKGFAARLRRADNPATEYQCWEALGRFGVNLEDDAERRVYALVAAALSRAKVDRNGQLTLGEAIARSFVDGNASDQANARLRRLLACDSTQELCLILRPLLGLIESRVSLTLDYERLLGELLRFSYARESVKTRWAQQFYSKNTDEDAEQP